MSNYKHGDWYCRPANETEAKEIIERAIVSGAKKDDTLSDWSWDAYEAWGVYNGRTFTQKLTFYRNHDSTEYTIEQVRELFPLPGERSTEWGGEGVPPINAVCEFRKNPDEWIKGVVFGHRHCNNGEVEVFIDLRHSFDWSSDLSRFRPIQTERERWAEDVNTGYTSGAIIPSVKGIAGFIFDAIKSGELKAPEVE